MFQGVAIPRRNISRKGEKTMAKYRKNPVMEANGGIIMPTGYQLVRWFPEWQGFHFIRQGTNSDWCYIYEWYLYLGFWELRKWSTLVPGKNKDNVRVPSGINRAGILRRGT